MTEKLIKNSYVCKLLCFANIKMKDKKQIFAQQQIRNNKNMKNKYIKNLAMTLLLFIGGLSLSAQVVVPSYSGDQCEGSTISYAANFPGATAYLWEFGNAGANTSSQENPLFTYADTGVFQIKLSVTKNGVTTVGTTSIRIFPKPQVVAILPAQDTQCFSTNKFCLTINSPNMPGNICTMKVLWGDGTFELTKNPTLPLTICKSYFVNSTVDAAYDIQVELTSCNGCVSSKIFPSAAVVKAALGLNFWSSNPKGCDSVLARFVNKSLITKANAKRFIWFFGDGTVDSANWGASPDWDTTYHWFKTQGPRDGVFSTKFYVETEFGCSDTFIDNASATNFVFRPRILSNIDSACSTADIDFSLVNGPPISTLRNWMWHFVDLPVAAPPCSGCEDNDKDYPDASFSYGGTGPFQVSLYMNHQICGPIVVFDTVQVIGPGSKIENIPAGIMIKQDHRYQCVAKDTVQFTNVSTFYHNDSIFKNDDIAYVWSLTDTFEMAYGSGEYGLVSPKGDSLTIFDKVGSTYTFVSKEFRDSSQRFHDGELVHEFKGDQTSFNIDRRKDNVFRIWDFDDPHAPKCTTDTKAGKNVGINCQYSMDTLPKHWYTDWDTALAYWRLQPLSIGIFNDGTKSCSRKNVWYSDSVAVIRYKSPFFGVDSIKIGRDSFGRGNSYTYIGGDSLVTDTIPLPFYKPGYHTLIKMEKGNGVTAADSIDPILYRKLYFNTTARCYNVKLTHLDTVHPFRCEKTDNISLAIRPPSAKGVQWRGIRCLAPPSPPYGIVFNVSQTKPGCSQDVLQFNFDSAAGKNNWIPMVGGLFPGSAPPPVLPTFPYAMQGTFPTSFVYLYTAGNVTDKKNGWVTVGTIVGNGATTTKPCYDTVFYNRMLKFRFANPAYTIERPIPRAQDDKAVCRYDSVYINMTELLQPEVETFDFNWGDGDRIVESKKSFDKDSIMKKYFSANIANIEKYVDDKSDLSGRMSKYAAYQDSVSHGWTAARAFTALDSFHFHQKLAYPRDSIKKWLDDPKSLIGWLIVTRTLDQDKVYEAKKGLFPTGDLTLIDTFLTSIVKDYKVNVIIAPEITPLIIDIFNQLGFDYFDIPGDKVGDFFGPPGSGRCIDTTGYSNFISFEYEEVNEAGVKRLSARDTSIIKNWYHRYEVAQIYNPRVLTRTRIDGCVQFKSVPIKVGFGKEIIFSDTVLCIDKPLFGLANYWYWSTIRLDGGITDDYDYWRDGSRIGRPGKEDVTKWDWNLKDAVFYSPGGGEYGGAGLGGMPYSRFRLGGGASGQTTILKSLTAGLDIGNSGSTIYYKSPGVFPLGILAVDSNGCRDTTKQDIYVTKVQSKFFFDLDTPACKSILVLEDSSVVFDGCADAGYGECDSIIEWIVVWGDGTKNGGKVNQNRDDILAHDYTRKGRFMVTMYVTTAKGCTDSFTRELYIPGPVPRFEPEVLRICVNQRLAFANKSESPTSSARWIFDFGDKETQDKSNVNDSFVHIYTVPGVYEAVLWQFDSIPGTGKYCPAVYPDTTGGQQQKIIVTVIAYDSTHINVSDDVICKGQEVVFFNSTANPDDSFANDKKWVSYKWIFDTENRVTDSLSSTDSFIVYAYQNSGVYFATVIPQYNPLVQVPYCPFRDTIKIFVDTVKAKFGVDTAQTPTMKFVNGTFNGSTYRWWFLYKDSALARSLSDGQTAMSTELNPVYTYDSLGCYWVTLEATSPNGCKDTTTQLVCNQFKFIVKTYNVFTPGNSDGKNDVFDIPIEGQDLYELIIYNRYGTKVFESNSSLNDWNGRLFNTGAYAASGTYYYYLRYKNKRTDKEPEEVFGVVELLK